MRFPIGFPTGFTTGFPTGFQLVFLVAFPPVDLVTQRGDNADGDSDGFQENPRTLLQIEVSLRQIFKTFS